MLIFISDLEILNKTYHIIVSVSKIILVIFNFPIIIESMDKKFEY